MVWQVCTKCGMIGYYHHKLKICLCSTCKSGDNIATMKLPYACKLLFQVILSNLSSVCFSTVLILALVILLIACLSVDFND